MKILISAAETSSDAHGAQLLRALREASPGIEAFGIGGPRLRAEGLRVIVDARDLLAMGFQEIIGRLPRIFRALTEVTREAERVRPDIAVVIDYPDFHFRLARRLKRLGIPVVYYVPPKVWVWRSSRLRILRERFVAILSILPFEIPFYREAGVRVRYVGNPVVDELPLGLSKAEARVMLQLPGEWKVLVAMPGSRPSELRSHLMLMLDGALRAARRMRDSGALVLDEKLALLMPLPITADPAPLRQEVERWRGPIQDSLLEIRVSQGDAPECMVAADAGLVKSGTSTLEAGLLGLPHAVVYRPTWLTGWLFRYLIRYRGPVGLVNLVADGFGEKPAYLMKELLCGQATPENLADEVFALFTDERRKEEIGIGIGRLRKTIFGEGAGLSPSRRAAAEVLSLVASGGTKE